MCFTSAREISYSLLACLTCTYTYEIRSSCFYTYIRLWLALFKYARSGNLITLAKLKSDFTRKARKECRALAKTYRGRLADEGACRSSCLVLISFHQELDFSSTSFTDAQFCGMTSFDWLIAASDLDLEGNRQRKRKP